MGTPKKQRVWTIFPQPYPTPKSKFIFVVISSSQDSTPNEGYLFSAVARGNQRFVFGPLFEGRLESAQGLRFSVKASEPPPNTSTSSSPEDAVRGSQKPSPGKCQKILGNLPLKNVIMPNPVSPYPLNSGVKIHPPK